MVRIRALPEIDPSDFGNADYVVVYDSETGVTKKFTKANLIISLVGTFGSSVSGTLVGGKAVVSTGVGTLGESSVTTTELGYLSGVTSGIQSQIDAISVGSGVSYTPTTATQNTIQPGNATSPNLTLQMLAGQTAAPLRITSSAGTLLLSSGTNGQLISAITTGTAPLSVASTTVVANLNADLLDGNEAAAFAASHTHAATDIPSLGSAATVAATTFAALSPSTLTRNLVTPLNATSNAMRMVGAASQSATVLHVGNGSGQTGSVADFVGALANTYVDSNGRACFDNWGAAQPFVMSSVAPTVTYLSADMLDGSHAAAFAAASHTHGLSSLTGDTYTAGQFLGGTGNGLLLAKLSAGTVGQCLGWTTGGAFTAITPGTGSGGSTAARIMFSATALDSIGTNGASLLNLGDATTARLCRGFDDTTETYSYGTFQVPYNINASGTVSFTVVGGMRSATSGSVGWTLGEREAATAESWTGAYTEYDSVATVVPGATTTQFAIGWATTASALGWASGDTVRFRVSRDPSASGDATGDALLDYFYIDIPTS